MSTFVWIMVMYGYGSNIVAGPEFSTQAKCEQAAIAMAQAANDNRSLINYRKPLCVRIEK